MKLTLFSLNTDAEEIDNVRSLHDWGGNTTFTTTEGEEYDLAIDFPRVYRIEVSGAVKPRGEHE